VLNIFCFKAIINQTVKAFELFKNTDQETDIVLIENARIVKIFERITSYVKINEQRLLIGVLLKSGRLFIEQFTKYSIPYFTDVFKSHSLSVVGIFKDFQSSTRMLQVMTYAKKIRGFTLFPQLYISYLDYLLSRQSIKRSSTICLCATFKKGIGNCNLSSQDVVN
jgi:hypothetical protein